MKALLDRLHAKLGDFWWYSLMLFCACRAADCLNVFVGLWLVPKYVPPSELGAVMPLLHFANFLTIPVTVFATTFRQELTSLAQRNELGKMKTLMRGVFTATAAFFVLAIVVSRILLPHFLERIRIAEGSLGLVILAATFIGAVNPVYVNALQALKKFKAYSLINVLAAPVRLLVMLITMPFRALTGYFVGQGATPAFTILASIITLRTELSVKAEPYWNLSIVKSLVRLFVIFGTLSTLSGFILLVESTIIRQRLPELDSAAYYMVTRFSDIASFLTATLAFTIFPISVGFATRGKDLRPIIFKAMGAIVASNILLAGTFALFGREILAIIPNGEKYQAYTWAIPSMVGIVTISSCTAIYTTVEIAASRFCFLKWWIPLNLAYPIALLCVSGHGYFTDLIPASCSTFLNKHCILSLESALLWMGGFNIIRLIGALIAATRIKPVSSN